MAKVGLRPAGHAAGQDHALHLRPRLPHTLPRAGHPGRPEEAHIRIGTRLSHASDFGLLKASKASRMLRTGWIAN